uniref:Adenylate cyclase n=1 Tax=Ganoderma boninense TaxID=34458 RepID=A0A5K1JWI1_9APHY|nr:Adenylate cyclase [Ganoderma boninense]
MEQEPSCLRSPSSSPSLAAVDSSPPSSPDRTAITPPASPGARDPFAGSSKSIKKPRIYERNGSQKSIGSESVDLTDVTPTRLARVVDPLSGSAKPEWVPPTYEKKTTRVASNESAKSVSSSSFYTYASRPVRGYTSPTPRSHIVPAELDEPDDFSLTDDEGDAYKPSPGEAALPKPSAGPKSREELEQKLWDEGIANAIDKLNGTIDLSGSSLRKGAITHIPPAIADLEGFIILPSSHSPSSAPPSPTASPVGSSRQLTRATTLAAPQFDAPFFRSRDGERLRGTPAARAASLQAIVQPPSTQRRRRDIHIYLANNSISKLPPEFFRVNALTVLSLRSNDLTFVPPQIAQLKALQELNLAQNKLRFLPAEMLGMRLTKLTVSESAERRRAVSDTLVRFVVPPLSEICLRILLVPSKPTSHRSHFSSSRAHSAMAPPASTSASSRARTQPAPEPAPEPGSRGRQLTVLEAHYALPLSEDDHYSPALLQALRACVPAAVSRPSEFERHSRTSAKVRRLDDSDGDGRDVHSASSRKRGRGAETDEDEDEEDVFAAPRPLSLPPSTASEEDVTGVSECPSHAHAHTHHGARGAVYVRHAEERWTWEEVVAGVHVGAEGTDGVPVRWRGCARGCLGFLDPPSPASGPVRAPATVPEPVQGDAAEGQRVQEGTAGEGNELEAEEEEFELELDLDIGLGGGVDVGLGADSGFGGGDVDVDMDMEDVW